jgi:hypothetical protein
VCKKIKCNNYYIKWWRARKYLRSKIVTNGSLKEEVTEIIKMHTDVSN